MLKGVFFDMDGVLVDSRDRWFTIFNLALEHFEGNTISSKEFDDKVWSTSNFSQTVEEYFTVSEEQFRAFLSEHSKNPLLPNQETRAFVKELQKKGLKLAVITNTTTALANKVVEGMAFDTVLGADLSVGKPAPDMILQTLQKLQLNKEDVVYVGDSISDLEAAQAAGVQFIGFQRDGDYRVENMKELKAYLSTRI